MPNSASTSSASARCCAVAITRTSAQGAARSAMMTGAILMASGRVPTMQAIFMMRR
jgi:hypothetical protein